MPLPLAALLAVAVNVFVPGIAPAGDVTVRVDVPIAPGAIASELVENVPVKPGGIAGKVRVSAKVPDAHPAVSLFVTLTV